MTKFLIVRDRRTGKPVTIATSSIPRSIRPDTWYENAYWMYHDSRLVLEPLIRRYLENEEFESHEVQYLAQYFLDYACHIAVMSYLFGGGEETVQHNAEVIAKLRDLKKGARTRRDLVMMIHVARDYALDPL